MRCIRLRQIRKIRSIRDELLKSGNTGRMRTLLFLLPDVSKIVIRSGGWSPTFVEITLNDGSTHNFNDFWEGEALRKSCIGIYNIWLLNHP